VEIEAQKEKLISKLKLKESIIDDLKNKFLSVKENWVT